MKITKKSVLSFIILLFFSLAQISLFIFVKPALATNDGTLFNQQTGMDEIGGIYGNQQTDVRVIASQIVVFALGFLSIIFLILIIIAGYRYMMASGNEEAVKKSTSQIKHAIIGLMISMASWAIARWVMLRIEAVLENQYDIYNPV